MKRSRTMKSLIRQAVKKKHVKADAEIEALYDSNKIKQKYNPELNMDDISDIIKKDLQQAIDLANDTFDKKQIGFWAVVQREKHTIISDLIKYKIVKTEENIVIDDLSSDLNDCLNLDIMGDDLMPSDEELLKDTSKKD